MTEGRNFQSRNWTRIGALLFASLLIFIGAVAVIAYTLRWDPRPTTSGLEAVQSAPDIDKYLADEESRVVGVKPDLKKEILYADPNVRSKAKIAIIYLHGFSASRGETYPLMNQLAAHLGANLFYTRLKAHGLSDAGESFAYVTAQDWVDDAREALAIGRRIGEKVLLVGMSTGAPLAIELAYENRSANDILGMVLMSPNYMPADHHAALLVSPFGSLLATLVLGKYHGFHPENSANAYLWTTHYRSEGLVAMMDLVTSVDRLDLSQIKVPVLTLYTSKDHVVDLALAREKQAEYGSAIKEIYDLPEADRHILASQLFTPAAIPAANQKIEDFVAKAALDNP